MDFLLNNFFGIRQTNTPSQIALKFPPVSKEVCHTSPVAGFEESVQIFLRCAELVMWFYGSRPVFLSPGNESLLFTTVFLFSTFILVWNSMT